jgi:hypothetical protein
MQRSHWAQDGIFKPRLMTAKKSALIHSFESVLERSILYLLQN